MIFLLRYTKFQWHAAAVVVMATRTVTTDGFTVILVVEPRCKATPFVAPCDNRVEAAWGQLTVARTLLYSQCDREIVCVKQETASSLGAIVECWASNTASVNPNNDTRVDAILQCLVSPAPQSFFVLDRCMNRLSLSLTTLPTISATSFTLRDLEVVSASCHHLVKRNSRLILRNKNEGMLRAGVDWTLVAVDSSHDDAQLEGWSVVQRPPVSEQLRCHQMAMNILSYVVDASDRQCRIDSASIDTMVGRLVQRLDATLGTDLRGRTGVDTMLALALAGVTAPSSSSLYDTLETVVLLELDRSHHHRPSFSLTRKSSKELMHIVEKLAAAGAVPTDRHLEGSKVAAIHRIVTGALQDRNTSFHAMAAVSSSSVAGLHPQPPLNLLDPRPLLWIWRFAMRLSRPETASQRPRQEELPPDSSFDLTNNSTWRGTTMSWMTQFANNTKPLVIDLGCGFGVSLLGLASCLETNSSRSTMILPDTVQWADCNFLGVDLHQIGIRFATGISQRWNKWDSSSTAGRLQYVWMSTEEILNQLLVMKYGYPGPVALIMLQFPTPHRLAGEDGKPSKPGNLLLPNIELDECMVSSAVLDMVARITKENGGRVLVQSNCEDVAVRIHDSLVEGGLSSVCLDSPLSEQDANSRQATERTRRWIERGGNRMNRAVGPQWSAVPLLPNRCSSETENSCQVQGVPVHRCILRN